MSGDASIVREADFSPCRRYRYSLRRKWGDGPCWLMVMLNPSIADERRDDPTTTFCMNAARRRPVFKQYEAVNLFPIVGTDPACLLNGDIVAEVARENEQAICTAVGRASCIVVAWGDVSRYRKHWPLDRYYERVRELLPPLVSVFGLTKKGYPRFPRALPAGVTIKAWSIR